MVTAGASAGLLLGTAACLAGLDPARMNRLPDTTGMRDEAVVVRSQRNFYDQFALNDLDASDFLFRVNQDIDGDDNDNTLTGGTGDDTITGGLGNDSIESGEGNDTLRARADVFGGSMRPRSLHPSHLCRGKHCLNVFATAGIMPGRHGPPRWGRG